MNKTSNRFFKMLSYVVNSLIFIWFLRILISAMFFLSAFSKMMPSPDIGLIWNFEYKQLILGLGFDENLAQYFSRSIIAFEIFIAISILLSNYLKRVILPISILLLVIFSSHLSYLILQGVNTNCGCFGDLIPMTPIQALIKNIITIAILFFLYKVTEKNFGSSFKNLMIIMLSSMLFMFIYVPLKSNSKSSVKVVNNQQIDNKDFTTERLDSLNQLRDSLKVTKEDLTEQELIEETNQLELIENEIKQIEDNGPDPVTSMYSKYIEGIDEGEKLLCFFVPGCEHCQIAAKQITDLSKEVQNFPNVVIVFMDEETDKIPDFFEIAGSNYDYQIMDIYTFMDAFWYDDNNTPGVVYLNNGNVLQFYQGSEESGSEIIFNPEELKKILENR